MSLPFEPDPPLRLLVAFQAWHPDRGPDLIFRAPDRDLWIAAHVNDDLRYDLLAPDLNPDVGASFTLQSARQKQTIARRPLPRWARFPAGVAVMLSGLDTPGLDAVYIGDETPGPRYDYAVMLLFSALLHELADRPYLPSTLTEIADAVLREYVDTTG